MGGKFQSEGERFKPPAIWSSKPVRCDIKQATTKTWTWNLSPRIYHGKETVLQRHNVSFEDERLAVKPNFYLIIFLFNSVFQVELLIFQSADSLMVVSEDTLNCLCDGHTQTLRHTQTHQWHLQNKNTVDLVVFVKR